MKGWKGWLKRNISYHCGGYTLGSNVQIVRRREENWHRLVSLFFTMSRPQYALWLDHRLAHRVSLLDSRTAAGHHLLTSLLSSTYWLEGQDVSEFTRSHVAQPLSALHAGMNARRQGCQIGPQFPPNLATLQEGAFVSIESCGGFPVRWFARISTARRDRVTHRPCESSLNQYFSRISLASLLNRMDDWMTK